MKKILVVIIATLSFLSSCSSVDPDHTVQGDQPFPSPVLYITIAHTTSTGGLWHAISEKIGEILREEYPGSLITVITGSSDGNLVRLQNGEIELAISGVDSANNAIKGIESFETSISLNDVKAIAHLYFANAQIFVLKNAGISSIEEMIEKRAPIRISVGSHGSGMEMAARRVFEAYGITYEDIESWGGRVLFIGPGDSAQMMADGQLDAYFGLSIIPMTVFSELDMKREFLVLPLEENVVALMKEKYEYLPSSIPAGAYRNVEADLPTISVVMSLYASGNLDEETAYLITKALLENLEQLKLVHAQLRFLTPEFMSRQFVIPLHSGSMRAYQE